MGFRKHMLARVVLSGSACAVLYLACAGEYFTSTMHVRYLLAVQAQIQEKVPVLLGDALLNHHVAQLPSAAPEQFAAKKTLPPNQLSNSGQDGQVTPVLEAYNAGGPVKRGLVLLHIGDSHTSGDFFTGELRRRLQARYGRGAPGYVTAGYPHTRVHQSSLTVKASAGWSYKSLQRPDATNSAFWLSGYNAITSTPNETLSFTSPQPELFEVIEIEVLRQPKGGRINVQLDGVAETTYDLASDMPEPVVIRRLPTPGVTEKISDISIRVASQGMVAIASVAIYNRQGGLTYNSIGYPGAQISLLNKFSNALFANDLIRINPHIVILSFGTNEASDERLDLAQYARTYDRVVEKIRRVIPNVAIVIIAPPDMAELPPGCSKEKAAQASCDSSSTRLRADECVWRRPARLSQIREVQHDLAKARDLAYWDWASVMPSECGAHSWFTDSPQLMARDHVHLTPEGYRRSAVEFLSTLIPVIEKVPLGDDAISHH
jgi:hypothetical protein